ncbi:MAG: outer membrane beta-barrel protein [Daejeonella sp.]
MKTLIISTLLCTLFAGSYAQEKSKNDTVIVKNRRDTVLVITRDSTTSKKKTRVTFEFGKKDSVKKDTTEVKEFKPKTKFSAQFVFSRIDLGLSTYLDNGSFTLSPENSYLEHQTWKSSNFGFEVFQMGYRFNSYFKVYLAAGLDWNHMRLKENITLQKKEPTLTYINEPIEFDKNRFSSQYLRIPLSFQIRSKDDDNGKKFNFVFGPEVGFLLNGKVKQISGERGKEKFKDDYNLEPFRYGVSGRIGYGGLGIYTKYYFNDVFAKGQGPADFKNLSFGVMLGF